MYVGQRYYWHNRFISDTIYTIVSIDYKGITVGWDDSSLINGRDKYTYRSVEQFKRLFVKCPTFKDYLCLL